MGNSKFSYDSAQVVAGKLAKLKLNMLPGSPIVHVEHLGETNPAYMNEIASKAGSYGAAGSRARTPEERKAVRDERRGIIARHAVRNLEAKRRDGSDATAADIPDWCDAIPPDVVDTVYMFALDVDNFRENSFATTAAAAEG